MFLSYQQVAATDVVQTVASLAVPGNATAAELLADTQDVRYTMDNATDPTETTGMILKVGDPPKRFPIDDVCRIRFVRGAGFGGFLNIHYQSGRDV